MSFSKNLISVGSNASMGETMILKTTHRKRRHFAQFLGPLRYLLPVARVHHDQWSYGWVLFPRLPQTLGYMNFGGGLVGYQKRNGFSVPVYKKGFKVVKREDYHNCTWTGVY